MKKTTIFLILSILLFTSCKKTAESEKKSWDLNLREANELKYEYPSFTNVINDQIKIAETSMNEALVMTDEKLKISKMSDSNYLLNTGFLRNLKEIKSLKYSIRTKSTEARDLKPDYNEMYSRNQAISDCERAVYDSDVKLRNVITSRTDADSLSGLVLSDLRNAVSNLDIIINRVKERERLEKEKADKLAANKAAEIKKAADAAQPVKCSYCGELNLTTAIKCKACGAPLAKK